MLLTAFNPVEIELRTLLLKPIRVRLATLLEKEGVLLQSNQFLFRS